MGLLLILGATIFALDPPRLFDDDDRGRELIRTENNPTPEGLETLPRRYSEIPRPPIELGPPLAGDIGPAVVSAECELGIGAPGELPFRPSPEGDAERAEFGAACLPDHCAPRRRYRPRQSADGYRSFNKSLTEKELSDLNGL